MGVDDIQSNMQEFQSRLEQLNQGIIESTQILDEIKEQMEGTWDDSMRKEYEKRFEPLESELKEYIQTTSTEYSEQLRSKTENFGRYLNAN